MVHYPTRTGQAARGSGVPGAEQHYVAGWPIGPISGKCLHQSVHRLRKLHHGWRVHSTHTQPCNSGSAHASS